MDNCILKIEKLENGYEVEIVDPDIREANSKPSKLGKFVPYEDPWKGFAFTDVDSMLKFIKEKIPALHPLDEDEEYNEAFATSVKEK